MRDWWIVSLSSWFREVHVEELLLLLCDSLVGGLSPLLEVIV